MTHRTLIITLLAITINCFNMCSEIDLQDYSFDISAVSNQTIELSGLSGLIKLFNCYPDTCKNSNYPSDTPTMNQQKAFLLQVKGGTCTPMTIGATTFQNYGYIDAGNYQTGLKIGFYPYISSFSAIDAQNNTYINETIYSSSLLIYCDSVDKQPSICKQSEGAWLNSTKNGKSYISKTFELTCSIYSSGGCPDVTLNNFWVFLLNNKIWFAVILWAISLFQFFLGYFVIRLTILIYGIMTGALLGIIFSAQNYQNFFDSSDSNGIITFIVILSFLMGAAFGVALLTLPKVGYVNIGFWVASIFSLLMQNSVLYLTGGMTAFYITLGISSFIMAGISLLGFRKFIIVSTSFVSSFWIVRTLGFVLPYYPNELSTTKLFAINKSTPWQFYLYLVSIVILTILGCVFQFCWYKKRGTDQGNKGYYLEDDDSIQEKFKKLLQFDEVKKMIKAGKDEVMFLKNLVASQSESSRGSGKRQIPVQKTPQFIEMKNLGKNKVQMIEVESEEEQSEEAPAKNGKTSHLRKQDNKSQVKRQEQEKEQLKKYPQKETKKKGQNQTPSKGSAKREVQIIDSEEQQSQEQLKKVQVKSKKQKR